MATVAIGLPQNYGSGRKIGQSLTGKKPELPKLSDGCKIQYKTVYDIVEKDIIEKKCTKIQRGIRCQIQDSLHSLPRRGLFSSVQKCL